MRSVTYPNIEAERARNGFTTKEISEKLNISRKTYYNWVSKGRIPQSKIVLLAELFEVSTDYLLETTNSETKQEKLQRMIESLRQQNS